jgi:hypothetical protein
VDFREDPMVETSTNRLGRSTIDLTLQAIARMLIAWHPGAYPRKYKRYRQRRSARGPNGQGALLRLARPTKVPQRIRELLNRLAKLDHEIENKTSPSIMPSANEGWLRTLLAARLR